MSWMLSIWVVSTLLALCRGYSTAFEGYVLLKSGYHLCTRNETRLVSFLVTHKTPYTVTRPCGKWLLLKTCEETLYRMTHQTEYKTVTKEVSRCCDGYVQVGSYCALPLNRSMEFTEKPGSCPSADGQPTYEDCEWDLDCPQRRKCCQRSGFSFCTDPESSSHYSQNGGWRFNVTVTVKTEYQQLMSKDKGLLNHTRLLHAMVTGALDSSSVSVQYLSSWPVHPFRTATSLLIDSNSTLSLPSTASKLHLLLKHIEEVSSVTVEDVDECAHPSLRKCSIQADCNNTVGSYFCTCRPGYMDVDPGNSGAECKAEPKETTTAVPPPPCNNDMPTSADPQTTNTTSTSTFSTTMAPTVDLQTTACSSPRLTSLQSSNVTGTSFCAYWSSQFQRNLTYLVVLSQGSELMSLWETNQTMLEMNGLQPGLLYNVTVSARACGLQGDALHVSVKTAAQTLDATVRLTNVQFTADLLNSSSQAYRNLTKSIEEEIYQSLSPKLKAMVASGEVRIKIRGLSQGSVVVNFTIVSVPSQDRDISNVSLALLFSLMNSSIYILDENSTSIQDVDECATGENDCSQWATCINEWATYTCLCLDGFTDNNPTRPGRACQAVVTTPFETTGQTLTSTFSFIATLTAAITTALPAPGSTTTALTSPIIPTTAPISTNSAATSTNTAPIITNTAPITTNTAPITTNTAPISPNTVPVTTNTAPISPNTAPISPNTVPVTTNIAPISPNTVPVTTNTAPITTNTAPISPNTVPVTTNTAPISPNTAPLSPSTVPVTTNTASISPSTAPISPNTVPVTTNTAPISPNTAPLSPSTVPVTTNTAPISPNTAPITTNTAPISPNTVPVTTNTAPITTNTAPVSPNTAPITTNTAPISPNTVPVTTNTAPITTNTAPISPNTVPVTSNTAPITTNNAPISPNAVPVTTNTAPITTNTAPISTATAPITTTVAPISTTTAPLSTTTESTTTTPAPTATMITTTAPPTTTTTSQVTPGAISVQCRATAITVTVARDFLVSKQISDSALYLGLEECGVNGGNATHPQLTVAWDECDTQLLHNDTYYTAQVTLCNTMDPQTLPNGTVQVPKIRLEVPIMCTYRKSVLISAGFGPMGYDMIKDAIMGSGSFHVTVQLMNGSVPLPQNYSLSPTEDVVVQVSLNSSVEQIKVVINKCWATPSNNPTDTPSYIFLENSCPLPNTYTTVLENGNTSMSRLSVRIFSFVNLDVIYLHCQVQICVQIGSATCVPDCTERSVRLSNAIGTLYSSSGPLFRSSEDEFFEEGLNTLHLVGFSCLGVGLVLFFLGGFFCLFYYQRNRIGHYNFSLKPKQENFTYLVFNT